MVSDGCFALNLIPYCIFHDIMLLWIINWVLFLDIHIQMCVPPNINIICGHILIFLRGLLSVSDDTDNCFRQKSVPPRLSKTFFSFNTAAVTAVRVGQNFKWPKV